MLSRDVDSDNEWSDNNDGKVLEKKNLKIFIYIYINYIHKIIGIMVQIDHCLTGLKSYKKLAGVGQSVLKVRHAYLTLI